MTTKEDLYKLISDLPDSELDAARLYLEYLRNPGDPVLKALLEASEDDEPLSKEDEQAIKEDKEDLEKGRVTMKSRPDQAYYWTQEWQDNEEQARNDIMDGRTVVLKDVDEVRAHFHSLMEQAKRDDQLEK